ncbi:pseudouridine synthase [Candidatus Gracilibacteria bacterium GN02-872]|nr:pseudouridine synthase [Candidatus Gracilibacteria bacterium GN02-872]
MEKIRLQKYLSQAGICSRRKAEEYILDGLVKVNGIVAEIGQSITPGEDKIELLQKAIDKQKNLVYYKLNKPRGIVTTCAQNQEKNIIDIINIKERVFPIGRLDKDTTGLILLTNDGRLANFLMHPKYNHEKEYIVEVFGKITDEALQKMSNGLFILGSYTKKAQVNRISSGKFSIIITEGRNRQIRRMVEKVGFKVKKLKRIRIENIKLGNLETGEYIPLTNKELNNLFERLGIKKD